MLLKIFLLLVATVPLVTSIIQDEIVQRRTGEDGKDEDSAKVAKLQLSSQKTLSTYQNLYSSAAYQQLKPSDATENDKATSLSVEGQASTILPLKDDPSPTLPGQFQSFLNASPSKDDKETTIIQTYDAASSDVTDAEKRSSLFSKDQTSNPSFMNDKMPTSIPEKDKPLTLTGTKDDKLTASSNKDNISSMFLTKDDELIATSNENKSSILSIEKGDKVTVVSGKDKTSAVSLTNDDKLTTNSNKEKTTFLVTQNDKPTAIPNKDKISTLSVTGGDKLSSRFDKGISSASETSIVINPTSVSGKEKASVSKGTELDKLAGISSKDKALSPPILVYSITVAASSTSRSNLSAALAAAASPVTLLASESEFPGFEIVPPPTCGSLKDTKSNTTSSIIPVWTPALLGNAYGGGLIQTPSVYVTKRPYPNGPSESLPPGYGPYYNSEIGLGFESIPPIIEAKNGTVTSSTKNATKPAASDTETPSYLTHDAGMVKPEVTAEFVPASVSKVPPVKLGIIGETGFATDKKSSIKSENTLSSFGETIPRPQYITQTIVTTTMYCPVTTISGKLRTLSSTTLTKTFVTIKVVAMTQGTVPAVGSRYITSSNAQNDKIPSHGTYSAAIEQSSLPSAKISSQTSLVLGRLPPIPSKAVGNSVGHFTNSSLPIGYITSHSVGDKETSMANIESLTIAGVQTSQITSAPSSKSEISGTTLEKFESENASAEQNLSKTKESLGSVIVQSNRTKQLSTVSFIFENSSRAAIAVSASKSLSLQPTKLTGPAVPISVISELGSYAASSGAPIVPASPTTLISELLFGSGASGTNTPTNGAASQSRMLSSSLLLKVETTPVNTVARAAELTPNLFGSGGLPVMTPPKVLTTASVAGVSSSVIVSIEAPRTSSVAEGGSILKSLGGATALTKGLGSPMTSAPRFASDSGVSSITPPAAIVTSVEAGVSVEALTGQSSDLKSLIENSENTLSSLSPRSTALSQGANAGSQAISSVTTIGKDEFTASNLAVSQLIEYSQSNKPSLSIGVTEFSTGHLNAEFSITSSSNATPRLNEGVSLLTPTVTETASSIESNDSNVALSLASDIPGGAEAVTSSGRSGSVETTVLSVPSSQSSQETTLTFATPVLALNESRSGFALQNTASTPASNLPAGSSHLSSLLGTSEVSEATGASITPSETSPLAELKESKTLSEIPGSSTLVLASSVTSLQGELLASHVLSTGTQASRSTSTTTNLNTRGNETVSVILSPLTALPFLGAGAKAPASFSLGITLLLITYIL